MLHKMELWVDDLDFNAIQMALGVRQSWQALPDSDEADANLAGRLVAEICRGWHDRVMEDRGQRDLDPDQDL